MENTYGYIEENLARVRSNLEAAAKRGGNKTPKLLAVTKSATNDEVRALLSLGIEAIGENRAQLFKERLAIVSEMGLTTEVHLIGSLQTNKVKYVVGNAALIQSLDSEKLAAEIERLGEKRGVTVPVLIEVNSGREENKGGLMPEDVLPFARSLRAHSHISPVGLMTMGPDCESSEDYRPYFRLTRSLLEEMKQEGLLATEEPILSMGMSTSYEVAAEEGATLVRVGRTLFEKKN